MVATCYLEHRIKYGNLEIGNTRPKILPTTRPCCSTEFIESFFLEGEKGILATYSIVICIYIYKVSYIHSFFIIFNGNVFSALHAKDFEIWKNILWKWWVDCFKPQSINGMMWYFRVFIVKIFSLLWSIFFSRKLCFLWPSCLLLIAESISLDTSGKPTVKFFLGITSPS